MFFYMQSCLPLFDLTQITNIANYNYEIRWSRNVNDLIKDMQCDLKMVTKWLNDSGLIVNESRTDLCVFHKLDTNQIILKINGNQIKSKTTINVLVVLLERELCMQQSKYKPYFNNHKLRQLLTTHLYSIFLESGTYQH